MHDKQRHPHRKRGVHEHIEGIPLPGLGRVPKSGLMGGRFAQHRGPHGNRLVEPGRVRIPSGVRRQLVPILLRPRQQVFRPSPRLAPLLLAAENGERLGGGNGGAYSLPRAKEQAVEPGVLPGLLRSRHEGLVRIALPGIDQQILRQPPQIRNAPFRAFKAAGLDQRQAPALASAAAAAEREGAAQQYAESNQTEASPFHHLGDRDNAPPPEPFIRRHTPKALAGTRNHHVRSPSVCGPAASGAAPKRRASHVYRFCIRLFLTAIAKARGSPTSTTRRLPRVTPV